MGISDMVDPKLALIAASLALYAVPAFAQDDAQLACDRCAAPQARYQRETYVVRSEAVTRVSYSQGYLNWPGKDDGAMAGPRGPGPEYGPDADGPGGPQCPPVRPGERVISCRFVPLARREEQADIAPAGGVLFADGGVGPEFIPSGGGGGGSTIVEASANSSSSASASASASASINESIVINERPNHKPPNKGNYPPPSYKPPSSGGSWPSGSMPSGGGYGSSGSMASNDRYGSWPSGTMSSGSGGVGGGHSRAHSVSHGHGRK
jgi:hypothetical protein